MVALPPGASVVLWRALVLSGTLQSGGSVLTHRLGLPSPYQRPLSQWRCTLVVFRPDIYSPAWFDHAAHGWRAARPTNLTAPPCILP